ncbi:MAG: DUF4147 domain-containing protein [Nanoarchaeota archaeon]|nr:DUF4147 domain-containing protein [Nanoarchaeota archaeon]
MIKNYKELVDTTLRKKALDILIYGIESVLPEKFIPKHVKFKDNILSVREDKYDISKGKLYIIGGGKASGAMAIELEKIIPLDIISGGIINDKTPKNTKKIKINIASHPIPDKSSISGVREMLELTKDLTKEDIVICLISGGGSSLMTYPIESITLDEIKELTSLMLKSGAEVYEINVIRKHISKIKGGKLARYLQPAKVITLIISDTLNPKDATASGPTWPDEATFNTAYNILKKYSLLDKAPKSIVEYIKKGIAGEAEETIKKDDKILRDVHNYILADNKLALKAMKEKADSLEFKTEVYNENVVGEARIAAKKIASLIKERYNSQNCTYALLYAGETTVTVRGKGKGGRNQEYIAALIEEIKDLKNIVVASIGSDGVDFIDGIGGAIADNDTYKKAKEKGLNIQEFLDDNNSFELQKRLDNLILTQPTNTNIADLHIILFSKK